MDSGFAVILGALIALAGSSLIPWLRDSLEARRRRSEEMRQRRDDALVELLAKNFTLALAWSGDDDQARIKAAEERTRASMRLLLSIEELATREAFSQLMNSSLPAASERSAESGTEVGVKMNALQLVLVRWSAGENKAEDLPAEFQRLVALGAAKNESQEDEPSTRTQGND